MSIVKVTQVRYVPPDAETAAKARHGSLYLRGAGETRLEVTMENGDLAFPESYRFVTHAGNAERYVVGTEFTIAIDVASIPPRE